MKILPPALQAHLDSGATTLCWCWRLTRTDGVQLGFTDHDRDLAFDGTVFEARSGFTASEIENAIGLNVDNLEAEGALRSDALNEDDLAAGLFDDAAVEIFRVNWQDVEQRVLMRSGSIGEISRGEYGFTAEIRGLAHYLQQPQGRLYQFGCDADLGDGRCQVDVAQAAFTASGLVLSVVEPTLVLVSGLDSFVTDWFSRGVISWTLGANQGLKMEVKRHAHVDGITRIELWQEMAYAIAPGDGFSITAGCDKQFLTCQQKFDNAVNFRGFPHIPGNDFLVSYPNRDDPSNDGSALE